MKSNRKFTRIGGFLDGTEYLEYRPKKGVWLKTKRRKTLFKTVSYTLGVCLKFVKRGMWKEIK